MRLCGIKAGAARFRRAACLFTLFYAFTMAMPASEAIAQWPASAAQTVQSGPISFTDDSGVVITLQGPATRLAPLYASFNETLLALGLQDRIIARTAAESAPQLAALPVIGTHMRPNLEQIISLKPDLVLQMQGREEAEEAVLALRRLGVQVAVFRVRDFEDLCRLVRTLGLICGAEGRADNLESDIRGRLAALAAKFPPPEARPAVFYETRYPNLLAAGAGTMSNAIIEAAGGRNCLKAEEGPEGPTRLLRLGEERLLQLNPAVYLVQKGPMNKNPGNPAERPGFAPLDAIKNHRVLVVDEDRYARPGPRNIEAAEELAKFLYP